MWDYDYRVYVNMHTLLNEAIEWLDRCSIKPIKIYDGCIAWIEMQELMQYE